ncbi:cytochrome P450 [Streptomyces sp. NPDC002825]|uniref:cytochrome P450 n=1 Tax=Streptomyces sp. NPDC002825 TaxID=3154666 RepID=UPI00332E8BCA
MTPLIQDRTVALLLQGYGWLPDARRRAPDGDVVRTRLLGRTAVALHGPEAVRFFYDEDHVRRAGALPGPVLDTLFGRGAVHTLDGAGHRARKELFVDRLTDPAAVGALVARAEAVWHETFAARAVPGEVVLFDEAALVLARAVRDWAGLPYDDAQAVGLARDCVAMVDGFATPGPRHLRARRARSRQEELLARAVEEARAAPSGPDTPFEAVVRHREPGGSPLDPHTAAVELLNIARPTIAIAWFVAFAGHALHRWPGTRERLRDPDEAPGPYARAFAHEVRRFYPFVPFVGGLAARDLEWHGEPIPEDAMLLLDVYGQNHDPALWPDPYRFDPGRFLSRPPHPDALIPQGGGDTRTGHRCPGEDITVAVLAALARALARLEWTVPPQDLRIPLRRIPTAPRSGFRIALGRD